MVVGLCYDRFVVSAAVGCLNEGAMVSAKSTATAAWVLTTGAWNDDARRYLIAPQDLRVGRKCCG